MTGLPIDPQTIYLALGMIVCWVVVMSGLAIRSIQAERSDRQGASRRSS